MMLAEIFSGENDWADFLFLIAAILAAVAAFLRWPARHLDGVMAALAFCAVSVGLLLQ